MNESKQNQTSTLIDNGSITTFCRNAAIAFTAAIVVLTAITIVSLFLFNDIVTLLLTILLAAVAISGALHYGYRLYCIIMVIAGLRYLSSKLLNWIQPFVRPTSTPETTVDPMDEPQPAVNEEIAQLRATIQRLNTENGELEAKVSQASAQHADLHLQIDKLREENQSLTQRLAKSNTESYDRTTRKLLELVQRIDSESDSFGDDCAEFLKKELSYSLKVCGLEFRDYSEEHSNCYSVEPMSAITEVNYDTRAIVRRGEGNTVCTGHVFVPINKQ